ncbi:DNA (cytosine-5-)-methyltransferase [Streptomyces arenae]|nr:DNA (cytosine-5-)-methyltransferase [Streptomyces arenae]
MQGTANNLAGQGDRQTRRLGSTYLHSDRGGTLQSGIGLTSVEICAGGGGQAIGLEQAGFQHLALVERNDDACETLRINRPSWHVINKDVRKFDPLRDAGLSHIDLLAGGIPCTPYSTAGKQQGAEDERDLLPQAIHLIEALRPRAVMLENAKSLAKSPKFEGTRRELKGRLRDLGYETSMNVLDAQQFGVSQRRERTVIVAMRGDVTNRFQWPTGLWELPPTVGQLLRESMGSRGWGGAEEWARRANDVAPTLVGGSEKHGGGDLGPDGAKAAWARMAVNGDSTTAEVPGPDFVLRDGVGDNGRKGYPKLTPEQTAMLQGFPSHWQFAGSRTSRYKQIGNAFPPPVAQAVATAIAEALQNPPVDEAA